MEVKVSTFKKTGPLQSHEIFGNWATLLLPINDDNSIDFEMLEEQIDLLIAATVDGIYSNGTAGEFFNQTETEFDRINAILAEKCIAAGMRFQIGCSHVNPLMCLERVARAVQMKPGAIQVVLPDWLACDIEEATRFLEKVAQHADSVGIVLYNPGHSRTLLTPFDIYQLKRNVGTLIGCKVSWKDAAIISQMAEILPDFSLFIPGHYLATGVSNGARGAYSNVACINPIAAQRWYEQMKKATSDALELERRIQRFMKTCIEPYIIGKRYSNTAADKFLAAIGGWFPMPTRLRWPYRSIPQADVTFTREKCKNIIPEFF